MRISLGNGQSISAKSAVYDKEKKNWIFAGQVRFFLTSGILEGERFFYKPSDKSFFSKRPVCFRNNRGDTFFAQQVLYVDNAIKLQKVRVLLADEGRLVASQAFVKGEEWTLRNACYTACKPCLEGSKAPTWLVKARKVKKEGVSKGLTYTDPSIALLGVPIFYAPRLTLPSVRSAGFLMPSYGTSTTAGAFLKTPYYYPFDHADIKVTPIITAKRGLILLSDYRQLGSSSDISFLGSCDLGARHSYEKDSEVKNESLIRGYLFLKTSSDIDPNWRFLSNIKVVSDGTYLRSLEGISSDASAEFPFLKSEILAERFSEKDFFKAALYSYQPLSEQKEALIQSPSFCYYISQPLGCGGGLDIRARLDHLHKGAEGPYEFYDRMILDSRFFRYFSNSLGQKGYIFSAMRLDAYRVGHNFEKDKAKNEHTHFLRALPKVGGYMSWPLRGSRFFIVNPFVFISVSPQKSQEKFPKEDSQGFEYTDTSLFGIDRLPGYDQVDSGHYMAWGVSCLSYLYSLGDMRLFLGQAFSFTRPHPLIEKGGCKKGLSDIVGSASLNPRPFFLIDYRFRFERKKFGLVFNEVEALVGNAHASLTASWSKWIYASEKETMRKQEMLKLGFFISPLNAWEVRAAGGYDFEEEKLRSLECSLGYKNDCLWSSIKFSRTYYTDRDLKPNNTYMLSIGMKNLGATTF